jgi:uncharacterized membrane protein (DUF485 family)
MSKEPPPSTPELYELVDVLRRNQMAWIMFWFLLVVFTIILCLLVYAAFFKQSSVEIKVLFGVLDGIIGWCIKQLVSYLFPSPSQR